MSEPRPPIAGHLRLVGLAMVASVALFSIVALVSTGASEAELEGGAAWAVGGAGLLLLGVGFALDGEDPGRRIVAMAAREAAGLIGAVLTFLTGSWIFAIALGGLAVAALVAGLPEREGSPPR